MPAKTTQDQPETRGRSTLYRGIRMRSRLEADFAAYLDRTGQDWGYETECLASDEGQWLPDFTVDHILMEIKPTALLDPRERAKASSTLTSSRGSTRSSRR